MKKFKSKGFASAKDFLSKVSLVWSPPQFSNMPEIDYIEKNLKVATEDDPPLIVPFKLNSVQKVYHKMKSQIEAPKASGKRIITLKARRMGVTTYEQGMSYAKIKTQSGARCVTVAQSDDAVKTIFDMVKTFHREDPNYVKPSRNSVQALGYSSLRSLFTVSTAGGTAIKRGDTLHRVHCSEVAHWDLNDKDANNLIGSLDSAGNKGEIVLESTANGPNGLFYNIWKDAQSFKDRWRCIFLGWYLDSRNSVAITNEERMEIVDTIDDDEVFLVERFGCNANQLAWRRSKMGTTDSGKKIFKQEFPAMAEEAFISTGFCYFDVKIIEDKLKQCKDPAYQSEGLMVWKRPIEGHSYIVAADTSEGNSDSDPSPIVVLDWTTCEQVYRLDWCARPNDLGHKCVEIAKEYNGALIAIENNNTGHSALNTVMNQCLYQNVYFHEDTMKDDPTTSSTPGWRTDGKSKPILLGDLNAAMKNNVIGVNDKLFLEHCRVFRMEDGRGRAVRGAGHHGDLVIAWGIALQVRNSRQAILKTIFV